MENGHFYYISDQYFVDFSDQHLMKNKETVEGQVHDRPCFYAYVPCYRELHKKRIL